MLNDSEETRGSGIDYREAYVQYEQALDDYASGLDELGEACDATSADEVENAISVVESAIEMLLDSAAKLDQSRSSLECTPDDDFYQINTAALAANLKRVQEVAGEVDSLIKVTPSDGEQLEEQLEKLIEAAEALYQELEDV